MKRKIPRLISAGNQHALHSENTELQIRHQKPGANYTGQILYELLNIHLKLST
jgi:hypothetical protein